MEARAEAKYIRTSPRKVRQVIDLIRNKDLNDALVILKFNAKASAADVLKVVESAASNAERNHDMIRDNLYIAETFVNEGPTLKRFRHRAMGRASRIRKRTCHITVVLKEHEEE